MNSRKNLTEIMAEHIVLFDGAMGTMLYQEGVFLNASFDELNLTRPDLVTKVHRAYVEVGVDAIETNTFGANQYKLSKFGLGDQVEAINRAAVEVARDAAGEAVLVAGAMGPLGIELTSRSALADDVFGAFAQQARALAEADCIILETFSNSDEILLAIRAVASVTDLPIIAQMTVRHDSETVYGEPIENAISRVAAESAVAAVGLNCSVGPSQLLNSIEKIRGITDKPLSVMPNAGMPREVEGRMLYMSTPEYMAEYAKRFAEKGVRIIGGCCGTTPEHIRRIIGAVRAIDKATITRPRQPHAAERYQKTTEGKEPVPLAERSRIGARLSAGRKITSIEITPPRGTDLSSILEKVRFCSKHGIDAVNIPDGPRASSRMSPMVAAVMIQQSVPEIEAILHVCCRDRNLIGMQADMLGASAIGLSNMLLITGDPPKVGEYPDVTGVFDLDSVALTSVVHNLNRGVDIGGNVLAQPLTLTIGVGANPVANDMEREIRRFREKVEAGAEYAITQPVFDVEMLLRFLDRIAPFRIPIISGIWPLVSYKNAEFMANEVPGVSVPGSVLERMSRAATKQEGVRIGVSIAREMMDAISDHVEGFAVSAPFGNVRIALAALGKIAVEDL